MKNTSKIHKVTLDGNFTQLPNSLLQSNELTVEEIYLISNLCSRPENFTFVKTSYWRQTQLGKDRFNKAWKGLADKGYIQGVKKYDSVSNLITGYDYNISYLPIFGMTGIQEDRSSGRPVTREHNNKDNTNKELKNIEYKNSSSSNSTIDSTTLNSLSENAKRRLVKEKPELFDVLFSFQEI